MTITWTTTQSPPYRTITFEATPFLRKKRRALGLKAHQLRTCWIYQNPHGEIFAFARYRRAKGDTYTITTIASYRPQVGWLSQ